MNFKSKVVAAASSSGGGVIGVGGSAVPQAARGFTPQYTCLACGGAVDDPNSKKRCRTCQKDYHWDRLAFLTHSVRWPAPAAFRPFNMVHATVNINEINCVRCQNSSKQVQSITYPLCGDCTAHGSKLYACQGCGRPTNHSKSSCQYACPPGSFSTGNQPWTSSGSNSNPTSSTGAFNQALIKNLKAALGSKKSSRPQKVFDKCTTCGVELCEALDGNYSKDPKLNKICSRCRPRR